MRQRQVLPDEKFFAEMGAFNEELVKAGVMLEGEGLHPGSKGARVYFRNGEVSVVDGPFTEAKELIAGFWLWQVKSMDEAIEWVKRCPSPEGLVEGQVEIRAAALARNERERTLLLDRAAGCDAR